MNTVFRRLLGVGAPLCLMLSFGWLAASAMTQPIQPIPTDDMTAVMQAHIADKQNQPETTPLMNAPTAVTPCTNGFAGSYPCQNIDLLAQVTLPNLGSNIGPFNNAEGSDIWGWTDPQTGVEYAIMLLENGTAFVDLSDPTAPHVTAFMPSQPQTSGARYWRDAKVYKNHAYVVADGSPNNNHGMQVFDLTR
ncbi:MAG: choice-of-anchor B family protein, partial [Anaerolineales bacterium]|nr:choice-of-anchor B family protein [Anaerolineales bacterium]